MSKEKPSPPFRPEPGPVELRLRQTVESRGAALAILLDPDRNAAPELSEAAEAIQAGDADFIFVGSSLMLRDNFTDAIKAIREGSDLPVVIFPGHHTQVAGDADAILFMSLISGRNPEFLIGQQVVAAPQVRHLRLEAIPTGYMLIESGSTTSVQFMSGTAPMPRAKPDIAVAHALAAAYMGMRVLYLEGGSGGTNAIPEELITAVSETVDLPIIVGGGIRTADQARKKVQAGAGVVVVGNSLEHAWTPEGIHGLADGVHTS
jgi:putative glycerol-1-phosphate prenyltransferase